MLETISILLGFALGRMGDKYLGCLEWFWFIPIPHHWIWGILVLIIFSLYWVSKRKFPQRNLLGSLLLLFGVGLVISDLNDLINLRFFGPESPHTWSFWSIL